MCSARGGRSPSRLPASETKRWDARQSPPSAATLEVSPHETRQDNPVLHGGWRSLGFRTLEAAERLVAGGCVKASYGRKKNLRAIWLCQEDDNQKRPATARGKARHVPVLVWSPGVRVESRRPKSRPVAST